MTDELSDIADPSSHECFALLWIMIIVFLFSIPQAPLALYYCMVTKIMFSKVCILKVVHVSAARSSFQKEVRRTPFFNYF